MICPHCGHENTRVIDSRLNRERNTVRRRRECEVCGFRFTTYESIEELPFTVVKKDGHREFFDPQKLREGLLRAFEKRTIDLKVIDDIVNGVEDMFFKNKNLELSSAEIGDYVLGRLFDIDEVAYVRFMSVYKEFDSIDEFLHALNKIKKRRKKK